MGLSMSQRRGLTKTIATRYVRTSKTGKGLILDEICATTGWHRNHARKALKAALGPVLVRPRPPRAPKYDEGTVQALVFCWATVGGPTLLRRLEARGLLSVHSLADGRFVTSGVSPLARRALREMG